MAGNTEVERWLVEDLSGRLKLSIESMTGEAPEVHWQTSGGSGETLTWTEQRLSAAPEAALYFGASDAGWQAIGRKVLTAAGIDEPAESDLKSTYQEILGQAASSHAQAIGGKLKREVVAEGAVDAAAPGQGLNVEIVIGLGEEQPVVLTVVFSAALVAALEPPPEGDAEERRTPTAQSDNITREDLPSSVTGSRTLELLLEVELPVSVSFGRAQLPLKDVLKLTSGSIVELNRSIAEPVEVIVNNCVIARGEVVVVEGNYGVRIQHIISRQERLRTVN
jgi:flagellar motor switch protein FliN/FliY